MLVNVIKKILTGCGCIDGRISGGISPESITLIYGEPEAGKTTLAIQCAVNCAMQGYKTLFMDCDNSFSAERLSQVSAGRFEEVSKLIILVKPTNFREQTIVIDQIPEYTANNFGLVVIDTVTSLYRINIADSSKKTFALNRELNRQMAILAQTAKTRKTPVVVTSQVTSAFNKTNVSIAPVATRVLKFWADTIIAMKPTENPQIIKAIVEKAAQGTREETCYLRMEETGLHDYRFHS